MSVILKPLKKSQLACLRQVMLDRIKESNITERSNVDFCMGNLEKGYDGKYMGAYVDKVEDPEVVLIISHFPGMATFNIVAHINLIYVAPTKRGDASVVGVLLKTAENYAKFHGADSLIGTSWIYKGAEDTSKMWLASGFEPQEKIFIKHLEVN
jgi:hypothetical protein